MVNQAPQRPRFVDPDERETIGVIERVNGVSVRVQRSTYQRRQHIDVRIFVDGRPTTRGLSIRPREALELIAALKRAVDRCVEEEGSR